MSYLTWTSVTAGLLFYIVNRSVQTPCPEVMFDFQPLNPRTRAEVSPHHRALIRRECTSVCPCLGQWVSRCCWAPLRGMKENTVWVFVRESVILLLSNPRLLAIKSSSSSLSVSVTLSLALIYSNSTLSLSRSLCMYECISLSLSLGGRWPVPPNTFTWPSLQMSVSLS